MQRIISTRSILVRLLSIIFLISLHQTTKSQTLTKVSIQASGLTCSLCSNAINKALQDISYVDHVIVDIKDSKFEISFKPMSSVSFDELKEKVESAGFFVASMEVTYALDQLAIKDEDHINMDGKLFHFMHVGAKSFSGSMTLKLIDKGFVTVKEYKRNARYTPMLCYKTGHVGDCCHQDEQAQGSRIYHVTI